jgi:predicted nucleic acid-binding protein
LTKIVSNATPLIYLAKIGRLQLLRNLFDEVLIPIEVKQEVVDEGKLLGQKDAFVVEKAIEDGWLKVLRISLLKIPIRLGKGETAVISLAIRKKVEEVLIDETAGRTAAKLLGLKPRGTVYVLMKSLKNGTIDLDEFLDIMNQLAQQGFRLREELYLEAISEARRIANQTL